TIITIPSPIRTYTNQFRDEDSAYISSSILSSNSHTNVFPFASVALCFLGLDGNVNVNVKDISFPVKPLMPLIKSKSMDSILPLDIYVKCQYRVHGFGFYERHEWLNWK